MSIPTPHVYNWSQTWHSGFPKASHSLGGSFLSSEQWVSFHKSACLILYTPTESSIKKHFKNSSYEIKGAYLGLDIPQREQQKPGPLSLLLT